MNFTHTFYNDAIEVRPKVKLFSDFCPMVSNWGVDQLIFIINPNVIMHSVFLETRCF